MDRITPEVVGGGLDLESGSAAANRLRWSSLGWIVAVGMFIVWVASHSSRDSLMAQPPHGASIPTHASDTLLAFSSADNGATQTLTVIDPVQRSMGVYQIDRATGEIMLRSVRSIRWDLQMEEFNTHSPKPKEIRTLTERRYGR